MNNYTKFLFVDYENRQALDLSELDESFLVIIFVGATQNSSKLEKKITETNNCIEVQFLKARSVGKNSLDFYIAFKLGQLYEVNKRASCFILSADKGFNALVSYINSLGMPCGRIESLDELHSHAPERKGNPGELSCCSCHIPMSTGCGVYDDGEWTCWDCLGVSSVV
ncbi:MAG: PIN domain-containing protein [Nitrosomonadales bacterium]|nr:PIN domain-containing protein [Nitrosomonadales bacterium]